MLKIFCFLLTGAALSFGQELCRSSGTPDGRCRPFVECSVLQPLVNTFTITQFLELYGGCGSKEGNIRLCCPYSPSPLTPLSTTSGPPPSVPSPSPSTTSGPPPSTPSTPSGPPSSPSPNTGVCDSPSKLLEEFGCITPIEYRFTWDEAQANCASFGALLLHGIDSLAHLEFLKEHFHFWGHVWVGFRNRTWVDGSFSPPAVFPQSTIWDYEEPTGGKNHDCGEACFGCPGPHLWEVNCENKGLSLCQRTK